MDVSFKASQFQLTRWENTESLIPRTLLPLFVIACSNDQKVEARRCRNEAGSWYEQIIVTSKLLPLCNPPLC